MPEKTEAEKLNPNSQVADVEIGIRNLRSIKIYPLSIADEIEVSDLVSQAVGAAMSLNLGDESDASLMQFIAAIMEIIKNNLGRILTLVVDEHDFPRQSFPRKLLAKVLSRKVDNGSVLLKEMSNDQAVAIAEVIYKVNFEVPAKNVQSLFEKIKEAFLSKRPSRLSAKDTESISPESTEKRSDKEASPDSK